MDTTDRLRSHFREQQHHAPPPGLGPDAVIAWGTRHRRQRALGVTVAALAAVAVGGFAALALRSLADHTIEEQAAPSTSLATTAGIAGGTTLSWETYGTALGGTSDIVVASDGVFYALSTAPGNQSRGVFPRPQAIYRSGDGITWDFDLLGDNLHASGLAASDGVLYMVTTVPAVTANGNDAFAAQVVTSGDGGASWSAVELPASIAPPDGPWKARTMNITGEIAAGPSGVVAAVNASFWFDYRALVPSEELGGDVEVRRTDTGLEVIDFGPSASLEEQCMAAADAGDTLPPDCDLLTDPDPDFSDFITYRATWEELGVADPGPETVARLFYSEDGARFDAIDVPFATDSRIATVAATESGFLAFERLASRNDLVRLWRSQDGRTWEEAEIATRLVDVAAAGMIGDRIVVVGNGESSGSYRCMVLLSADGGASWSEIDLASIVEVDAYTVQRAAVGPSGVIVTLSPRGISESTGVLHSPDLTTWSFSRLGDLDLAAGNGGGSVSSVASGADRVLINQTSFDGVRTSTVRIGTPID